MDKEQWKNQWKERLALSTRDTVLTVLIVAAATGVCFLLKSWDDSTLRINVYAIMVYVLAVLLVSRMTNGYVYGTLTSLIAVVFVNYVFTYPFFAIDFTAAGYPVTFVTMMAVSLITSTMTSKIKEQEKLRMEKEKESMRANLLRAVSHDLRTPLTSILGATSAILENEGKLERQQERKLLGEVKEDAEWLIRMVENLLSVTKITAGETKLQEEVEFVEEIAAEAVQKFKKHFPERVVNVSVPEEPLMVPMDAILIEQVINNLLENAALHSGSDEAFDLTITARKRSALFQVRDYGKGVPEKEKEAIFNGYFYENEKHGVDSKKNMGIGLSVCMSIIKAHGGRLWAENAPDGGAIFSFWLPLELQEDGSRTEKEGYDEQ